MAGKYDMGVPRHAHLFRKGVARIAPDLRTEDLTGAIRYYDAQVDDARLVVAVARTAASHGAHVATRTRVIGFLREGERVVGIRAIDLESGRELEVRAKVVVNAAGVWTDEIQEMVGGRAPSTCRPARASTWSCRATGSARRPASSPGPRPRCCS